MGLQTDLETAIYSKLTTTSGTALYADRVYPLQAPQDAPLPYVVVTYVGGGDTNESQSRIVDVMYQIVGWAADQPVARQIADYLEAALHDQALTISGWNHIATTQVSLLADVETEAQQQFWMRGAEYRIRMSK